ncbi:ADP-ribosylation factor-like protein 16 [Holothuria leucospilota]|uniref:ADP-ribosylation factor-like protein 16 n=1 Tax=Holothuria leucospilota TaxID=206669 RepID=A0A9Q1H711_HOLLE|nr:ADP-ribosylation factor-like protein 16 [Holothuria leucospilota]
MAPIWPTYLSDSSILIFMVDSSNPAQVSASTILLLTTLASEHLQNASVLVLLNKIDLSSSIQLSELKYIMQLEELLQNSKQNITVLECSVKEGTGLKEVIRWIGETTKGAPSGS